MPQRRRRASPRPCAPSSPRRAERFGQPLHGVIHAAGVASGGMVQLKTPEAAEEVLGAQGPRHPRPRRGAGGRAARLLRALLGRQLGARRLRPGGLLRRQRLPRRLRPPALGERDGLTVAIGWDTWSEVGVGGRERAAARPRGGAAREPEARHDDPRGAGGVRPRPRRRPAAGGGLDARPRGPARANGSVRTAAAEAAETPRLAASHGRPALSTAYVAPESETERRSPASGRSSSASRGSAPTTTSSSWAGIR